MSTLRWRTGRAVRRHLRVVRHHSLRLLHLCVLLLRATLVRRMLCAYVVCMVPHAMLHTVSRDAAWRDVPGRVNCGVARNRQRVGGNKNDYNYNACVCRMPFLGRGVRRSESPRRRRGAGARAGRVRVWRGRVAGSTSGELAVERFIFYFIELNTK